MTNAMKKILLGLAIIGMAYAAKAQITLTSLSRLGYDPHGVTAGQDGYYYGTTEFGQTNYYTGTFFKLSTNGTIDWLANMTNVTPNAPLITTGNGVFYGTGGGVVNFGSIFKINSDGSFASLVSFTGTNYPNAGRNPVSLTFGRDGLLYGTTGSGGSNDWGTVFKCTTNGVLTSLFSFVLSNGVSPTGITPKGVVLDDDGFLYGTCRDGGQFGCGTFFRMSTNGALATLLNFSPNTNGSYPSKLMRGSDGFYYGTTGYGGGSAKYNAGTIFRISTNGLLTTLFEFNYYNGFGPNAAELREYNGAIYGSGGNTNGLFRFNPSTGEFKTIYTFTGSTTQVNLTISDDGYMYGTVQGGVVQGGAVFKLNLNPGLPLTSIITYSNQPVIVFPMVQSGVSPYTLQMNTNLASTNWVTVTNGVMMNAILITNAPPAAFFRLQ